MRVKSERGKTGQKMSEKLANKFAEDIEKLKFADYFKGKSQQYLGLWFPMLGFCVFWVVWYATENIIMRYEGNRTYKTQ